jgi:hypothetical protein
MPVRRPSAAGSMPNSSSRAHRSTDSHHAFVGGGLAQPHSLQSLGAAATPQQKVVQVLVNRLKNKVHKIYVVPSCLVHDAFQLPCNSGVSLDRLEADTATQQAIETLVELSHDSLDIIAWALSELLERLAKVCTPPHLVQVQCLSIHTAN